MLKTALSLLALAPLALGLNLPTGDHHSLHGKEPYPAPASVYGPTDPPQAHHHSYSNASLSAIDNLIMVFRAATSRGEPVSLQLASFEGQADVIFKMGSTTTATNGPIILSRQKRSTTGYGGNSLGDTCSSVTGDSDCRGALTCHCSVSGTCTCSYPSPCSTHGGNCVSTSDCCSMDGQGDTSRLTCRNGECRVPCDTYRNCELPTCNVIAGKKLCSVPKPRLTSAALSGGHSLGDTCSSVIGDSDCSGDLACLCYAADQPCTCSYASACSAHGGTCGSTPDCCSVDSQGIDSGLTCNGVGRGEKQCRVRCDNAIEHCSVPTCDVVAGKKVCSLP